MESDIGDDIKEEEIEDVTVGENSLMCDECPTELKNEKAIARHKKDYHEHKLKQAKALLDLFNAKNMRPK